MKTDTLTNGCEELKSLFLQGIESLKKAGDKLLEMLEAGGSLPDIAENSGIPADVLAQLERIGRNQLNPSLLLANYPAAVALQRLSVSEQNRLLASPAEVLILKNGAADTLLVDVKNMTREQVTQVFAKGHVRALPEQRAWLESRAAVTPEVKVSTPPYTITRKKTVIFNIAVEMTAKELIRIAQTLQD
jgi:hypothetical protein